MRLPIPCFCAALLLTTAAGCTAEHSRLAATAAPPVPPPAQAQMSDQARLQAKAGIPVGRLEPLREAPASAVPAPALATPPVQDRETYAHYPANPVQRAARNPVSTFSIDVDTGSYANVRRFLDQGRLPPSDAVRVEELVNYFDYDYAPPVDRSRPFAVHTEIAPTPWNSKTLLLRIGIQGWKPSPAQIPPSNLVFLVDVSGSMDEPDKLPLVKSALKLLTRQMGARDRIALVVYAGNSGVVLEPTPADQDAKIEAALDRLEAGGSTNGASGIRLAYQLARQAYIDGGNNRVLLATDGDFNVGTTDFQQLLDLIRDERRSGIALTTLGVGGGNYNDRNMERLADAGDGNYAYLDSLQEAEKVLVSERAGTLMTIARDVKIQVEFNPARVAEYRLIGYEDRVLRREDFDNDKIDAGDIGAGHRVTALYEIALAGSGGERIQPLRYAAVPAGDKTGDKTRDKAGDKAGELAFMRLRYKRPEDGQQARSQLIQAPILARDIESSDRASASFRLAAAVAAYGQLLRGGTYTGRFGYADVRQLARSAGSQAALSGTEEFLRLTRLADALGTPVARASQNREE